MFASAPNNSYGRMPEPQYAISKPFLKAHLQIAFIFLTDTENSFKIRNVTRDWNINVLSPHQKVYT